MEEERALGQLTPSACPRMAKKLILQQWQRVILIRRSPRCSSPVIIQKGIRCRWRPTGELMNWARLLAYITGTVDQELLLRNEYLAAENRILTGQLKGRLTR